MPAPIGNKNKNKGSDWVDSLRYALANYETADIKRGHALKAIARKVVEKALDGDKDSILELGNRLDGKPNVSVDVTQTLEIIRTAAEMTDDELATLASAGSGRTAGKAQSEEQPTSLH
jgi:hypothetical protein